MPELGTFGSVRGASSNGRSYRDIRSRHGRRCRPGYRMRSSTPGSTASPPMRPSTCCAGATLCASCRWTTTRMPRQTSPAPRRSCRPGRGLQRLGACPAADDHHPADEAAHAPWRTGRRHGPDLPGRARRQRGRAVHPAAAAGGGCHLPHRLRARAGQKVLTLRGAMPREGAAGEPLCADIDGCRGRRVRRAGPLRP